VGSQCDLNSVPGTSLGLVNTVVKYGEAIKGGRDRPEECFGIDLGSGCHMPIMLA
jgi:hypothetical protein